MIGKAAPKFVLRGAPDVFLVGCKVREQTNFKTTQPGGILTNSLYCTKYDKSLPSFLNLWDTPLRLFIRRALSRSSFSSSLRSLAPLGRLSGV